MTDDVNATHEQLWQITKKLPSDFEPYGERSRDDDYGPDCSVDCKWFLPVEGNLGLDWGTCFNSDSPRAGLLTFEHQGCKQHCGTENEDSEAALRKENEELKAELERAKQKEEARKCLRCRGDPCFCQK